MSKILAIAVALLLGLANGATHGADKVAPAEAAPPTAPRTFELLGEKIQPGRRLNMALQMGESFAGAPMTIPVSVTHGEEPGPAICLVAGIHGDELNGVEIVRRTVATTSPTKLKGVLIGVPIANLHGLQRGSRYLPDRRDLNRYFPGRRGGSAASRIADVLFRRIVNHCDVLVDFHTGSLRRTNLSQLRADLTNPAVVDLARRLGDMPVIHNTGRPGTLRRATTDIGVAAVTYEAGEPLRFDDREIDEGVERTRRLIETIDRPTRATDDPGFFLRTRWVRVDQGGILLSQVSLGSSVSPGDVLGTVTNPLNDEQSPVTARRHGRVIGMAVNQVVIPGFAAYHLGLTDDVSDDEPPEPEDSAPEDDDAS